MKGMLTKPPKSLFELNKLRNNLPALQNGNLLNRYLVFESWLQDISEEFEFTDFIDTISKDEFYINLASLVPKSYPHLLSEFHDNGSVIVNKMLKKQLGEEHSYIEPVFKSKETSENQWKLIPDVRKHILKNAEYKIFLLIAGGGIGKTTFLWWINKFILDNFEDKVPIFLNSGDLDTHDWENKLVKEIRRTEREADLPFNKSFLDSDTGEILNFIKKTAQDNNLVLLIDGLNESKSITFNRNVKNNFTNNIKVLVTREEYVKEFGRHNQDVPIEKIYIDPFNEKNIAEYLGENYDKLKTKIEGRQELFRIPIVLRFAYDIYMETGKFNFKSKSELYSYIIKEAQNNESNKPSSSASIPFTQLMEILPYISFKAIEAGIIKRIDENGKHKHFLAKTIKEYGEENPYFQNVKNVIDAFKAYDSIFGIYTRQEGIFEYYHQSFQEYFAACYLQKRPLSEIKSYIRKNHIIHYLHDEAEEYICPFEEVLIFLGGMLGNSKLEELAEFIADSNSYNSDVLPFNKLMISNFLFTDASDKNHLTRFFAHALDDQDRDALMEIWKCMGGGKNN